MYNSNNHNHNDKIAQKAYITRYDWVDKVIHRELCKKFESDYTNKWYMQNPESLPENEMYKRLWDFGIPNLSQTIRPHNNNNNKRKLAQS